MGTGSESARTKRSTEAAEISTLKITISSGRVSRLAALATIMESLARMRGARQAPLITRARIKFLGLNLGYSCEKIKQQLGYVPRVKFAEGMPEAVRWVMENG